MNNLKNYRENEIKWYIIAFLLLLLAVCYPTSLQGLDVDLATKIEKLLTSSLFAGAICTLAFVFDSIFPANVKEGLLFLGFTKMPGKTIFTRISNNKLKDARFSNTTAKSYYADIIQGFPVDKKDRLSYENERWYKIYSRHREDERVVSGHRDFLLCRDLYITTISLSMMTVMLMLFSFLPYSSFVIAYLAFMLMATNLAAHNKAHRFANTILAVELSNKKK